MTEPLKTGERYRCPHGQCGCVIEVIQGAQKCEADQPQPPKCCCGCEMINIETVPSR